MSFESLQVGDTVSFDYQIIPTGSRGVNKLPENMGGIVSRVNKITIDVEMEDGSDAGHNVYIDFDYAARSSRKETRGRYLNLVRHPLLSEISTGDRVSFVENDSSYTGTVGYLGGSSVMPVTKDNGEQAIIYEGNFLKQRVRKIAAVGGGGTYKYMLEQKLKF